MMAFIYYLCGTLLIASLLIIGFVVLVFLVSPKDQKTGKKIPRGHILVGGVIASLVVMFVFGGIMSVTEPDSIKAKSEQEKAQAIKLQKETSEKERLKKIEASKPKTKIETKKGIANFSIVEKQDNKLPIGERKVATVGVNGERTVTYEVTYVNNKETARREVKNEVTKAPVDQIVLIGTYVKPTAPAASSGNGYTNSQGNYVPSPSSNPSGATARCADGSYSYSQSRRGTCSHHGGVAEWL